MQQQKKERTMIQEINQTHTSSGAISLWFIGQEGVVIKGGNTVLYIDPYLSDYPEKQLGLSRKYPPPISPQDITNIDYYLISHDHLDHLDPGTVKEVAKQNPETVFIAPAYCHDELQKLGVKEDRLIRAGTEQWINREDLRIMPIPAAHETLEEYGEWGHRFVGYIIQINGVTIYHAGDTVIYPGLLDRLKRTNIDIGMLPINGRDAFRFERGVVGNMNVREAAELAYLANFDMVIPLHYDTFADNCERPGYFADYMYEYFPEQKFHIFARGEQLIYVKPDLLMKIS